MAIERAEAIGVGIVTTTYHDHIGSAGKYVRMALRKGLIGVGLSGRNAAPSYSKDATIAGSIQGSPPFCVGMPSGPGSPPFLLDMATKLSWDEEMFAKMPEAYLKSIGISHVANILSGTLGGQMQPRFDRDKIEFSGANQSAFFMALQIDRFVDPAAFLGDMDHLMSEVGQMQPLPGFEQSELPGGPEWRREKAFREEGIPLHPEAQEQLEGLAAEFGVGVPWGD
jgi:LDH2 family malate/lactate/ureidoglycolate dehydrogenase